MGISQQIEAVYQRALVLRQRATTTPIDPELISAALKELYFVLEELQTADEDIQRQNTKLLAAQQQLEIERQRYRALFELAPDGYLVTDRQGIIHHANQAAADLLAVPQASLMHKPLVVFVEPDDRTQLLAQLTQVQSFETWDMQVSRRHQPPLTVAAAITVIGDAADQNNAMLWSLRDITRQKQAEATIHHQAFYDALTRLPNRTLFDNRLPIALTDAVRHQEQLAVIFLDLDRFKQVNDALGHHLGDRVMQLVGQRLHDCLREQDTIARWGGDEFTLVLPSVESPEAVAQTCDRLMASLETPFTLEGYTLWVSLSFGIAMFPQDSDDPDTLVHYADLALHQAKSRDCGYWFYQPAIALTGTRDRHHTKLEQDPRPSDSLS
jgi:diguanylate cyclase (GGDEF)-like protein/PAS domain S-box-containing protein